MKITIAIPTIAGRTKYLASALKTCVEQSYDNMEIIVSDNSPGEALTVVQSFKDNRIKYIRPDRYLPMSAHWDFMVPHFSGDMVTIIGDDDGLTPGALKLVSKIVQQRGIKPIQHSLAYYCWPDFPLEKYRNKIWFTNLSGAHTEIRQSKDYLVDLCNAKTGYIDGPTIYHNFIPRNIINKLLIDDSIFHRSSPDIYSAISIAAHTDEFVITREALTMSGHGARSNGASVRDGGADGKRFISEMRLAEYVPRFRSLSVQLHTLDSILEASERYSQPELKDWIDYGAHFCCAANECLDMPNRKKAARQLALVVLEATKSGCLPYLLRDRGGKLLEKIGQTLRGQHETSGQSAAESGFNTNVKYEVPTEVTDIYGATMHLNQLLKNGCKP